MERRTSNIILLTKNHHPFGFQLSRRDVIAKYMAETCGTEESDYSDSRLLGIVQNVVLDYLKTTSAAHQLLFDYFEASSRYGYSELESWLTALSEIQVMEYDGNDWNYINGFDEDSSNYVKNESTGERMYQMENSTVKTEGESND